MDAGKMTLYVNGEQQEDVHHYEPGLNEIKDISFCIKNSKDSKNLTIIMKYNFISKYF